MKVVFPVRRWYVIGATYFIDLNGRYNGLLQRAARLGSLQRIPHGQCHSRLPAPPHQHPPLSTLPIMQQQDQIQGNWREDAEKTGKGVIFSPGKFYYEGEILHGKASGKGRILWDSRAVYEGTVLQNKANGTGALKLPEEDAILKGEWNHG